MVKMNSRNFILVGILCTILLSSLSEDKKGKVVFYDVINDSNLRECVGKKMQICWDSMTFGFIWANGFITSVAKGEIEKLESNTFLLKKKTIPAKYLMDVSFSESLNSNNEIIVSESESIREYERIVINDKDTLLFRLGEPIILDEELISFKLIIGDVPTNEFLVESSGCYLYKVELSLDVNNGYDFNLHNDTIVIHSGNKLIWKCSECNEKYVLNRGEKGDYPCLDNRSQEYW